MGKRTSTNVYYDRNTFSFTGITYELYERLSDTFPGIDIDHELKKMTLWLDTSAGKKRIGNLQFILGWLNRAYRSIVAVKPIEPKPKIIKEFSEHQNELWKNCEEIFSL